MSEPQDSQKELMEKKQRELLERIKSYGLGTFVHDLFALSLSLSFSARFALLYLVLSPVVYLIGLRYILGLGFLIMFYFFPAYFLQWFPTKAALSLVAFFIFNTAIIYMVSLFFERLGIYKIFNFKRHPGRTIGYIILALLLFIGLLELYIISFFGL